MDIPVQAQSLYSIDDLAEFLGVAISTLYKWVQRGEFPPHIRLPNGQLRVMHDDLDAWLLGRRRTT